MFQEKDNQEYSQAGSPKQTEPTEQTGVGTELFQEKDNQEYAQTGSPKQTEPTEQTGVGTDPHYSLEFDRETTEINTEMEQPLTETNTEDPLILQLNSEVEQGSPLVSGEQYPLNREEYLAEDNGNEPAVALGTAQPHDVEEGTDADKFDEAEPVSATDLEQASELEQPTVNFNTGESSKDIPAGREPRTDMELQMFPTDHIVPLMNCSFLARKYDLKLTGERKTVLQLAAVKLATTEDELRQNCKNFVSANSELLESVMNSYMQLRDLSVRNIGNMFRDKTLEDGEFPEVPIVVLHQMTGLHFSVITREGVWSTRDSEALQADFILIHVGASQYFSLRKSAFKLQIQHTTRSSATATSDRSLENVAEGTSSKVHGEVKGLKGRPSKLPSRPRKRVHSDEHRESDGTDETPTSKLRCRNKIKTRKERMQGKSTGKKRKRASKHKDDSDSEADCEATAEVIDERRKSQKKRRPLSSPFHQSSDLESGEEQPTHCCGYKGCSERFWYKAQLELHRKTVHGKTYECDECGKKLTTEYSLKLHKRTHQKTEESFPHECTFVDTDGKICGARFQIASQLTRHKDLHGQVRFACPVENCSSSFKLRGDLNRHIEIIHMKKYAFKCTKSGCGKVFKRKQALEQHVDVTHKNIKKHKCLFCGKTFRYTMDVTRHRQKGECPFYSAHPDELNLSEKSDKGERLSAESGDELSRKQKKSSD